jgi:para-aminobenzoate synthetase/4-amino-4-deoxychorismate lyase
MKEDVTFERIAATLSREGSLWFESAFCKAHGGGALLFSEPVEVVMLSSLTELEPFFRTLEEKLEQGYFLAGWLTYEAGYGFEQIFIDGCEDEGAATPLGWFGLYRQPELFSAREVEQLFSEDAPFSTGALSFNLSEEEYARKISTIKAEIAAGNLYQVNFTGRYRFGFNASPLALFSALRAAQPSSYTAFINSGKRTILSFSPELFFAKRGAVIETMPMKGTAPRGQSAEEDRRLKEGLGQCPKNLAENLMIVDLLRNDLGRICKTGTVEAGGLFSTESWPTLHQMVSTIRGEHRDDVGLYELFRALYPCGSITGAPKISAMKLIRSLEPEPRGIYTGTIGFMTPDRDMVFNVAIRTVELSREEGIYGSGGGIVWDSDPKEEYRECQLKAKILASAVGQNFSLFESILWAGGYLWLEEHIERLALSAIALGFPCNKAVATLMLERQEEELRQFGDRFKVKLTLSFQGLFTLSCEKVEPLNSVEPLRLFLSGQSVDASQPLLYHKTTARELYNHAYTRAQQKGYDEVIFFNERGEVTEGAISNIFIRKGRYFYTPPIHCGLLDGIFRRYFLATRPWVTEKVLTVQELREADMVYIANSVRGLRAGSFMVL